MPGGRLEIARSVDWVVSSLFYWGFFSVWEVGGLGGLGGLDGLEKKLKKIRDFV